MNRTTILTSTIAATLAAGSVLGSGFDGTSLSAIGRWSGAPGGIYIGPLVFKPGPGVELAGWPSASGFAVDFDGNRVTLVARGTDYFGNDLVNALEFTDAGGTLPVITRVSVHPESTLPLGQDRVSWTGKSFTLDVRGLRFSTGQRLVLDTTFAEADTGQDRFEPDNTESSAKPAEIGVTQTRSILPRGDVDIVRLTLDRASDVVIETGGGETVDTEMWLTRDGVKVAYSDDARGAAAVIEQKGLPSGNYLILVQSWGRATEIPRYTLKVSAGPSGTITGDAFEDDDTRERASVIPAGTIQRRSIHRIGDRDWLRVDAKRDSLLTATVTTASPANADPVLRLFPAKDSIQAIATSDDVGASRLPSLVRQRIAPGSYYLLVTDARSTDPDTGYTPPKAKAATVPGPFDYSIHLDLGEPGDSFENDDVAERASWIARGEIQSRSILPGTDTDFARFRLDHATDVTIETAGSFGDTVLWLLDRNGNQLGFNDDRPTDGFSILSQRLEPGEYLIKVQSYANNAQVPRYSLRVSWKADPQQSIADYLASLKPIPFEPTGSSVLRQWAESSSIDGVPYRLNRQTVRMTRQLDDFTVFGPFADAIWPGAYVQGATMKGGRPAPIYLARVPGEITVATDFAGGAPASSSRVVDNPTLASITDARNSILRSINPTSSAGGMSYLLSTARTLEQGMLSLGFNISGVGWGIDGKAKLDKSEETSTVIASFMQEYYRVTYRPTGSPAKFFADSVTVDQLRQYSSPENPPCYVSQVIFGRLLFVTVTARTNSSAIEAALKGTFDVVVKGSAELNAQSRSLLAGSTVKVYSLGGQGGDSVAVLTDPVNQLPVYLRNGANYSLANPGAPISYTVRYMGFGHQDAKVSWTTDYDETASASAADVTQSFQVWDGPDGGPFSTGILVRPGDTLRMTANGRNWSGVLWTGDYGPEGWSTWTQPANRGYGYPVPNRSPFALVAGWNNSDWFFVGRSFEGTVGEGRSRTLWLGTNDDWPYNGDPTKRFTVEVNVRRGTLPGVGSTAGASLPNP